MIDYLKIHPEVEYALQRGMAVVALESTIVAHGMPYPDNIQMAKEVGAIIRSEGAIPATIACFDGYIHVGLTDEQLERLGTEKDVMKVSRRDLAYALSMKKTAATTVASTMITAEMAGIKLFVTGGIGGVHREWARTMDISADLIEFSKTNVAVISAGAKAILDIPATLEFLETLGVPVISFKEQYFGAFYSKSSRIALEMVCQTPKEIAQFLHTKWNMGLRGGVLVSNPIPEKYELPIEVIEPVILNAISSATEKGIQGKALTPYLLATIKKHTEGESLSANIELVKNNAQLGAKVAVQLSSF